MIPDLSTPLHHDDNVFWSHFFSYASHSPQEGRHFVVFFHDREGHGVAVLHDIAFAFFSFSRHRQKFDFSVYDVDGARQSLLPQRNSVHTTDREAHEHRLVSIRT